MWFWAVPIVNARICGLQNNNQKGSSYSYLLENYSMFYEDWVELVLDFFLGGSVTQFKYSLNTRSELDLSQYSIGWVRWNGSTHFKWRLKITLFILKTGQMQVELQFIDKLCQPYILWRNSTHLPPMDGFGHGKRSAHHQLDKNIYISFRYFSWQNSVHNIWMRHKWAVYREILKRSNGDLILKNFGGKVNRDDVSMERHRWGLCLHGCI